MQTHCSENGNKRVFHGVFTGSVYKNQRAWTNESSTYQKVHTVASICCEYTRRSIRVIRETHDAPVSLQLRLGRAGGLNRFGEPNFRAVWGWSRLAWIGGKWTDTDANGNVTRVTVELRQAPKYIPFNRWHIERWTPPESYGSPKQWYAQTIEREGGIAIPALGPYPRRGDYEHCFTLQGPRGEFLPLSPSVCEFVVRAVEFARTQPTQIHRSAFFRREERREREWESCADAILADAAPAFHGAPFVATV